MRSLGHQTLSISMIGVEPIFASSWAKDSAGILVRSMPSNEAYSGAGKTHPQKQVENQKENAI